MTDDEIKKRTPKLREGLDILEQIENKVLSLESRLTSLSMNLIGGGEKAIDKASQTENKDVSDNIDGLGKIVHKGYLIAKILTSAEECLAEIEREI